MQTIIIATCKAYPKGNKTLEELCAFLCHNGFNATLQIWQDIVPYVLPKNAIILPLAVWDYSLHVQQFLDFLHILHACNIAIFNNIDAIQWNISKTYLLKLKEHGIPIIPSIILQPYQNWEYTIQSLKWEKPIIKPLIGQSGKNVCFLHECDYKHYTHGAIIQPFMKSIITHGEVCLIFFNNIFSHCIHRIPSKDDWRANSAYNVQIKSIQPKEQWLQIAYKALSLIPFYTLYARIDILPNNDTPLISEIEIIEPSLYFEYKKNSMTTFLKCFLEILDKNT